MLFRSDQKPAGTVPPAPKRNNAVLFTVLFAIAVLFAVVVGIAAGLHH